MIAEVTNLTMAAGHHVAAGYTACQQLTGADCDKELPHVTAGSNTIPSILQIAFGVLGAVAILMIVIAGLRFVTGSSNPQETAKARSTIIYALVGLLVAVTAEGFVSFVLDKL